MADENTSTPEGSEGAATAAEKPDTPREQSEESLGDAGKKALQEERRKARAAEKRLAEMESRLKEFEDRDKTEAQKLAEARTAAEQRASQAEQELMRYRVAAEKKLPAELAARLRGSTPEEMAEDADSLLELIGSQQRTPSYDGGVRTTARPTDMNSLIRQAAGRG
ncbi:hypothetical protein LUW77_03470 [Streptomyces radiopugnans]|nr:hypothetical protein LUW77_03470 [Streptomyces radiopugnans]